MNSRFEPKLIPGYKYLEYLPREAYFGRASSTWDAAAKSHGRDVLPLNIAEVNLPTPRHVREAIAASAQIGLFGYTDVLPEIGETTSNWCRRRFNAEIDPEQVVFIPRMIQLIALLCSQILPEKSVVAEFAPAYSPIDEVVKAHGHRLNSVLLDMSGEQAEIDFDALEKEFAENRPKMCIFCSPHNPTGRVWTKIELERVANLCSKYHTLLICDEVHADLAWGAPHTPMAEVCRVLPNPPKNITVMSPAKAFNLAGAEAAVAIIQDSELRSVVGAILKANGFRNISCLARDAILNAWDGQLLTSVRKSISELWLQELHQFIPSMMSTFLSMAMEQDCHVLKPKATSLLWIQDKTGFLKQELERENIIFSSGADFSADNAWLRVNAGFPFNVG